MEKKDIIFIAIAFAALGISLYRKYARKNQSGKSHQKHETGGSSFPATKEDDYEPYSKK